MRVNSTRPESTSTSNNAHGARCLAAAVVVIWAGGGSYSIEQWLDYLQLHGYSLKDLSSNAEFTDGAVTNAVPQTEGRSSPQVLSRFKALAGSTPSLPVSCNECNSEGGGGAVIEMFACRICRDI